MLRGRDVEHARSLVIAVDVVALDGGFDFVQILQTKLLQDGQLFREAFLAVCNTMGEAGFHEAAVAAGGTPTNRLGIDQDDIAVWVTLLRDDGGPQACVAATNDAEVATFTTHQCGI